MFIPGSTPTTTNLPIAMNNNLHQQAFLFDNLKDHRSNKLLSPMSRKTSATPNFSLDPDLLRELNARYLHDINLTRPSTGSTNSPLDGNGLPTFPLPPFLRAEHYHQHTHTHEHNLNILTPTNNALLNGNLNNPLLDKLSKSDNGLSPFLRTNNFLPPPPPPPPPSTIIFPPFNSNNNNHNNNSSTKETLSSSPSSKKSSKWCTAHVRISWMIYHQQQRSKEKLSPSDNKKDEEQQQQSSSNSKLPDLITNTKPLLPPPSSSSTSDLSLPLPSTYQPPLLPPPSFNYRSPFEFAGMTNGPFGRVPPSSTTAFGGLGSLFPPPPLPPPSSSSTIDRKSDMNGSLAAAAALGLDWSRFHRGIGPSSLIPPLPSHSSTNENLSLKKLDDTTNSNHDNKKRSSSVLNNNDDDRRSSSSHHHLMLPPSHLTNPNYSSSHRSRSRSPHRSLHHQHQHHHHHSSSNVLNKTSSSSPPLHSSSRKRHSPNVKSSALSDISKTSLHPSSGLPSIPLPPTFGALDPLTLSIIERQRLSAAYASLFNAGTNSLSNNFFPGNLDSPAFRTNGSSNIFPNLDSSAMTAALMQREHFLNSIRQQQEQINERERAATSSLNKSSKISSVKPERISPKTASDESSRISPKVSTSPGSHSSTSSSSRSSKKLKRENDSPSPPTEPIEMKLKEESTPA